MSFLNGSYAVCNWVEIQINKINKLEKLRVLFFKSSEQLDYWERFCNTRQQTGLSSYSH